MSKTTQMKVMQAITAVMLVLTYIAAGFAVVAGIPETTYRLSLINSQHDESPFSKQQLADLAVETRDYTVSAHDLDALMAQVAQANEEAGTPYADATKEQLLNEVPDEYTLDAAVIAHLDDVNEVVGRFFMPLLGVAMIAAFCLMGMLRMYGSTPVGRALLWAGAAALVLSAVLGIWALVGFDGLFAGLHAVFFADGTWVFPADSLLIRMYPGSFWAGMAMVWLVVSCVLAALSTLMGWLLVRRQKKAEAAATSA